MDAERGQPRKSARDQDGLIGPGRDESPAPLPHGLCANRSEHAVHVHDSDTLGRFWCMADQGEREPYRSERSRACPRCFCVHAGEC